MSNKEQLSAQRKNTVINTNSKREDKQCVTVVKKVITELALKYGIKLLWEKKILLVDIIADLKKKYPSVSFGTPLETSFMSPDGGITYIVDKTGKKYPFLIVEVKNQGTNDMRAKEGLRKQAKGNAIERLGKNVIGFRTYLQSENIFPFICFGDGCDFEEGSSILDRVITIAMFGELNKNNTINDGPNGIFNRGSYYFKASQWTPDEMYKIIFDVAKRSMYHYFSKYGEDNFIEQVALLDTKVI